MTVHPREIDFGDNDARQLVCDAAQRVDAGGGGDEVVCILPQRFAYVRGVRLRGGNNEYGVPALFLFIHSAPFIEK